MNHFKKVANGKKTCSNHPITTVVSCLQIFVFSLDIQTFVRYNKDTSVGLRQWIIELDIKSIFFLLVLSNLMMLDFIMTEVTGILR